MSKILSSLRLMQRMERFATQVYRNQTRAFGEHDIADKLQRASDNEKEHADTLSKRLHELKGAPSKTGILFDIAGAILGFKTTLISKVFLLKTDIWIEKRAVRDYSDFLQKVDFDEETKALLSRIIEDEKKHIETWNSSIKVLKSDLNK
ncbi:MAG: ferritin-like domain-containing protein [Dehalococcoidales bacterium]